MNDLKWWDPRCWTWRDIAIFIVFVIILIVAGSSCAGKQTINLTSYSSDKLHSGLRYHLQQYHYFASAYGQVKQAERMPGNTVASLTFSGLERTGYAIQARKHFNVAKAAADELKARGDFTEEDQKTIDYWLFTK